MEKNLFVTKFLKSAFKAADSNIVDITYQNGANGEFVYIYAKGQGNVDIGTYVMKYCPECGRKLIENVEGKQCD